MTRLRVLVLGSGAREHALAWRLARDASVRQVWTAPGNAGSAAVGERLPEVDPLNPVAVVGAARRVGAGLVVIGGEAPLAAGVSDALAAGGIPVFGPSRAAARLEWSKAFAKAQLDRAGVWTPRWWAFDNLADTTRRLDELASAGRAVVVKADGLAAGKGVAVPPDPVAARAAAEALFAAATPGAGRVVVEERMEGREVSVFALVSDRAVVPLGAVRDAKRLRDGDSGPNTGGMGAYAPVPDFGADALQAAVESIFRPIAAQLADDGTPYRGVLYGGLMLTAEGHAVLEFNARFGDPEAQVLLPRLEGDFALALLATAAGRGHEVTGALTESTAAAVGVVLASAGYPDRPAIGRRLQAAEPSGPSAAGDLLVFFGGVERRGEALLTSGGRVATFVGRGPELSEARARAYDGLAASRLPGGQFRSDIGHYP